MLAGVYRASCAVFSSTYAGFARHAGVAAETSLPLSRMHDGGCWPVLGHRPQASLSAGPLCCVWAQRLPLQATSVGAVYPFGRGRGSAATSGRSDTRTPRHAGCELTACSLLLSTLVGGACATRLGWLRSGLDQDVMTCVANGMCAFLGWRAHSIQLWVAFPSSGAFCFPCSLHRRVAAPGMCCRPPTHSLITCCVCACSLCAVQQHAVCYEA